MGLDPVASFNELIRQPAVFLGCLFGAVSVLSFAFFELMTRKQDNPLRQRLRAGSQQLAPETHSVRKKQRSLHPVVDMLSRFAARPIMPKQREEQSRLRRRLGQGGCYSSGVLHVYVACKLILLCLGLGAGALAGFLTEQPMFGAWLAASLGLIGYVLPGAWLAWRVHERQRVLQSSLPDALDLMVVCVEAGLTIDAALQRVGQEIALAHPDIARELMITHTETRMGVPRVDALRNLGNRTGCAALQSLAAMLVQAERFGTSIATALRVHAESMRVKRQHEAEERAAKTTVKLAFPVVLFIFPTVVAVLGGPAFILFLKSPIFAD